MPVLQRSARVGTLLDKFSKTQSAADAGLNTTSTLFLWRSSPKPWPQSGDSLAHSDALLENTSIVAAGGTARLFFMLLSISLCLSLYLSLSISLCLSVSL